MLFQFLLHGFFVYLATGSKAPFIQKCKADDTKCLKESARIAVPIFANGLPKLGVEKLDPIFFKYIDGSSNGITLKMYNFTGIGLKDSIVKKLERDVSNSKLLIKLQCSVDFHGQYFIDGQVLILHMEGKGNIHVTLKKLVIEVEADMGQKVGEDGEKHWTVKSFKYTFDLKDKSVFELDNLFENNEVLALAARELFASSSNEIIKEVGAPVVKAVVIKIIDNVKNFFSHVPIRDLVLDI